MKIAINKTKILKFQSFGSVFRKIISRVFNKFDCIIKSVNMQIRLQTVMTWTMTDETVTSHKDFSLKFRVTERIKSE